MLTHARCDLEHTMYLFHSSASSPIISPSSVNYTPICKQVFLPLCVSHAHNLHFFYLMSMSSRFHVNCITTQLSKSDYIPPKEAFLCSALFSSSSSWKEEEKKTGGGRKKRKGHEWWMLCVCLSFPITELCLLKRRCICHFCLSDWWRAGSDWGHCVLNTASLVFQHWLQLQYATLLAPALQCPLSSFVTLMFIYHMHSFSILWYVKK